MTKSCCKVFEKLAEEFDWMSYVDNGEKILIMPHIVGTDYIKYRINNCPSCGAEVRDIEITETEFNSYKNQAE
jgi:hypothetical protein